MSEKHIVVPVRPPNLFLGSLALGAILELIYPIGPGLAGGSARAVWIGLGIAVVGIALGWKAIVQFTEAGTTVPLDEPTDALVTNGLYAWSRNPIYVALTTAYSGLAIALTSGWALILLPFTLFFLQKTVIEREEELLAREFGDTYLEYKKKVPRWL